MAAKPETKAQDIGTLADGRALVRVACEAAPFDLPASEDKPASQWVHVLPAGPFVAARDGRTFQVSDPFAVAAATELPLLFDKDHESESFFGSTEAVGWGEELKVQLDDSGDFPRPGIWARVEWCADCEDLIRGKRYRFISPVIAMDSETRDVAQLISAALTNKPALHMQALDAYRARFSARFGQLHTGERAMNLKPETVKALFTALGLADGATDEQVLEAFSAKTKPAATGIAPELFATLQNQFNAAQTELSSLKAQLAEQTKAAFAAEVKAVLDEASKAGKVPPASRAGFEKQCETREGFELFKTAILPHLVAVGERAPASPAPAASPAQISEELRARGVSDDLAKKAAEYNAQRRARQGAPSMED